MKKILMMSLLVFASQVFAISELEKLLLKEAVAPEAKKTTKEYFIKRASDYKDLAKKYEALAKGPQGGKVASEMQNDKKYKDLAKQALDEAAKYQAEADKL
jgi:protein subunit release factor A